MFTASGEFELAPAVENMEVAAAVGSGGGGHSNDGLSSRADRKPQWADRRPHTNAAGRAHQTFWMDLIWMVNV